MPEYKYGNSTIEYTLEHKPDVTDIIISVDWIDGVKVVTPPEIDDIKLQEVQTPPMISARTTDPINNPIRIIQWGLGKLRYNTRLPITKANLRTKTSCFETGMFFLAIMFLLQ